MLEDASKLKQIAKLFVAISMVKKLIGLLENWIAQKLIMHVKFTTN